MSNTFKQNIKRLSCP